MSAVFSSTLVSKTVKVARMVCVNAASVIVINITMLQSYRQQRNVF